jgi:hypothetical protein
MPDLITSVGPHKRFPTYLSLGCPGPGCGCSGKKNSPTRPYIVNKTPLNSTRVRISGGDRGIAQTIRYMYGAVMGNEGVGSPEIRRQAIAIVGNVASRDQAGEISTVLQWVKDNIKFRGEYAETVQTPLVTLQLRAGDCDDQASLIAALLSSLGYKTRFRTVAADPSAPHAFSHVFTEIYQRKSGQWISLDPTVPQSYPGWAPDRVFRSKAWRTMGDTAASGNTTVSTGPVSTSQMILQLTTPIANAIGQRIAYGNNAPRPNKLGLDINTTSLTAGGISPVVVYVGGAFALGLIVWMATRRGR